MLHPDVVKYFMILSVALAGCKKNASEPPQHCDRVIAEWKENKNLRYEYNAIGKIQSVMREDFPEKTLLAYDAEGRLINSGTNTYRYEKEGKKIVDAYGSIYLINNNNQVIYWEYPPQNNQVNKGTFEYDNNGFMTKSQTYTYNTADLSNYTVLLDIVYTNTVQNGNLIQANAWKKLYRAGLPANLTTSSFRYTYDAARPNNIPDTDYRPYKYAKRSAGLLLSETDGTTTNNYTYKFDTKGRVVQVDRIQGGTIETIRTFKYQCE